MKKYTPWFGAAGMLIVIFGTMYTVTQQSQRSAANYPQIQLAEDAAAFIKQGGDPYSLSSNAPSIDFYRSLGSRVDIDKSLAPFLIVYDKTGTPVNGSGYLSGRLPAVPYGVLTAANGTEYHSVTWQPAQNVRIAAVAVTANNYYVLSGRNMKEVEKNESRTMVLSAFGFFASLLVLAVTWEVRARLQGRA